MAGKPPRAPEGLGNRGGAFWRKAHKDFHFTGQGELELLCSACKALDIVAKAEKELKKQGLTVPDRWSQARPNPNLKIISDFTSLFSRLCKQLNLKEPETRNPVGRPAWDSGRSKKRGWS
jgi:phage terminase small subunit